MNTSFNPPGGEKGPLARVLTVIVGLLALAAAFMFSLVVFAVLAVAGLLFWLYFWWKTRELRRQMREQLENQMNAPGFDVPPTGPVSDGEVIEGEATRVVDESKRIG